MFLEFNQSNNKTPTVSNLNFKMRRTNNKICHSYWVNYQRPWYKYYPPIKRYFQKIQNIIWLLPLWLWDYCTCIPESVFTRGSKNFNTRNDITARNDLNRKAIIQGQTPVNKYSWKDKCRYLWFYSLNG